VQLALYGLGSMLGSGISRYFEIPIIIPALGALVCLVLVVVRVATGDWRAPATAGVLLLGSVAIYALLRPKVAAVAPSP
jgi:hypothetical protein